MIKLLHYHSFNKIITSIQNFYSSVWLKSMSVFTTSELLLLVRSSLTTDYFLIEKFKFKEYLWNYLKKKCILHNWISDFSHINHHKTPFCDDISELNTDYSMSDTIWTMFAPSKHYQLFFLWSAVAVSLRKHLFKGLHPPYFTYTPKSANHSWQLQVLIQSLAGLGTLCHKPLMKQWFH